MAGAPLQYVGVFRNAPVETVSANVEQLGLVAVQLHGSEDQNYIDTLRKQLPDSVQIWKA
jgi:indole-3-glycerol phosphate synthase/phosphoribosylanthranilate isomerase